MFHLVRISDTLVLDLSDIVEIDKREHTYRILYKSDNDVTLIDDWTEEGQALAAFIKRLPTF